MDVRWKHPFTAIVSSPTGSGKTVFTFGFIREAANMEYNASYKTNTQTGRNVNRNAVKRSQKQLIL